MIVCVHDPLLLDKETSMHQSPAPSTLSVVIHGITATGEGVGRMDNGRVVFVDGALPGDTVRIRFTAVRKGVQYADVVETLDASVDRIASRCAVEGCGGCVLRGISGPAQQQLKRQRIEQSLRRLGGVQLAQSVGDVITHGDGWRYRHRVRLHCVWDGKWRIGYFERRSHRLIPLKSCPVLWPELEVACTRLSKALATLPSDAQLREIEVAYSRRDQRAAARIFTDASTALFRTTPAWLATLDIPGVEIVSPDGTCRHGNLDLRYDHALADQFDLFFEPGVFTQAFPEINDLLVAQVLDAVQPAQHPRVVEFHAGIGNFSIPMARAGAHVITIERASRAVVLCGRNARAADVVIDVRVQRDDEAVRELKQADVVLMDPTREGARALASTLAAHGPDRLIYVSCDAATFARDAALLYAGGYRIRTIRGFDMFPETPHVETFAVFER